MKTTVKLSLNPEKVKTIRSLLAHEKERYIDARKMPPAWINESLPKFIDALNEQDKEHSIKGELEEAEYEFDLKGSKSLSYLMYNWLTYIQEARREFDPYQLRAIIHSVFEVADVFAQAHEELFNTYRGEFKDAG